MYMQVYCHFKFPKIVLLHILGKVGTSHSFVKCSYQDMPTIFIAIGTHLTDTEPKNLARFIIC